MGLNLVIELAINLARQLDEAYEQREVKVDPSFGKPPLKPKKSFSSLRMNSSHVPKFN